MGPRLVCNPPLGFVTVVNDSRVRFTFAVALCPGAGSHGSVGRVSDTAVWHNNTEDRTWAELPLHHRLHYLPQRSDGRSSYFNGSLARVSDQVASFRFTVKFRLESDAEWQWAKEIAGLDDGEVIFAPQQLPNDNLSHYVTDSDHDIHVEAGPEKSKVCFSWELSIPVAAARGRRSGYATATLGIPVRAIRWFAIVRHNEAWFGPRQGRGQVSLDKDGILISFLRDDGVHVVLLTLSFDDVLTTLGSDSSGNLLARCRNDRESTGTGRVFAATAIRADVAINAVFGAARSLVRSLPQKESTGCNAELATHAKQQVEDWHDGLAYCTWNGLGQDLTPARIIDALDRLGSSGVHASNLIIDDNWQSLDFAGESNFQHRWTAFEANKENFPDGLKALTSEIRRRFPFIQNIAVWHGIFGYWGGMATTGDVARAYAMRTVKRREGIWLGGGEMTTVDGPDAHSLFDDFYRFLAASGVNAVKTDTQSFLDYPEHAEDRSVLTASYQTAWRSALVRHFDGKAIACMAQIPQNIPEFLRDDRPALMMRNSDDFFPDDPGSHTWHVFSNAHVALLSMHLNVLPDWDMFQTVHHFSRFHAAARCLSGGPIYITDRPGQHDGSLIGEMTANTPDGRLVILRPEVIGRTAEMYLQHTDARLLRIQARHGQASMLGIFNVGSVALTEFVFLRDFLSSPDADPSTTFIIHRHGSASFTGPYTLAANDPVAELTVVERGVEILTAHVVRKVGEMSLAVLGLLGKMSGAAAVIAAQYDEQPSSSTLRLRVALKALGILGVGILGPDFKPNSITVAVRGSEIHGLDRHLVFSDQILRLDLVGIWESLGGLPCSREDSNVEVLITLRI
ncbi:seed imbibition protein [Magnaporthiopsis poae ATCC 64411]|uniref:Seed imbibition protein n=1 Tax=Magnaporthiopsis poae (strain ATCC 64411 / 73-15) TaxID=644358 RepID=A0A0C4E357_MAGP6|nr:seed imbibition protein [Magnaporthiopsis poae ATCC 64411]